MHRRQFLETVAVGTLELGLLGASWLKAPDMHVLAWPGLLAMLGEDRIRTIGRRFRERFPGENDESILRAAILAHGDSDLTLPEEIQRQVHDDFSAGRTILLDGWVLSITEARQCALFSHLHP
jgi:hypothetical protein